jgi:hypothetical protein
MQHDKETASNTYQFCGESLKTDLDVDTRMCLILREDVLERTNPSTFRTLFKNLNSLQGYAIAQITEFYTEFVLT